MSNSARFPTACVMADSLEAAVSLYDAAEDERKEDLVSKLDDAAQMIRARNERETRQ